MREKTETKKENHLLLLSFCTVNKIPTEVWLKLYNHLNEYTVNIEVFISRTETRFGETCYYYYDTDFFLWLILSVGHSLYIHIYFTFFSFHSFFTALFHEEFKILYKEKEVRIVSESIIGLESNDFASTTTFDTSLYNWYNFLTLQSLIHANFEFPVVILMNHRCHHHPHSSP